MRRASRSETGGHAVSASPKLRCTLTSRLATASLLLAPFGVARAQQSDAEIERLKEAVEAMQKTIAEQNQKIEALQKAQQPVAPAPVPAAAAPPDDLQRPATFVVDKQARSPAQRVAPRPDNANLQPTLPGFWSIPGTQMMLKIGGDVSTVFLITSKLLPSQTTLVTSSIPVSGQPLYDTGLAVTATANQSNLSLEFRMPTPVGSLRIVYDNDFSTAASSAFVYDLNYFYAQAANVLVGFSDSVFVDVDAWPATLDYEGVNAYAFKRHVLVRYTWVLFRRAKSDLFLSFSVEQPGAQIPTSATSVGRNVAPDGAIAARMEGPMGHLQLATVLRAVGSQNPSTGQSQFVFGWGLALTFGLNLWGGDILTAGVGGGQGVAAYFNDTGGLGLDAAVSSAGQLTALPILGVFAGYTHQWAPRWTSTASYGYLTMDNAGYAAALGTNAFERTQYASLNVVFRPWKAFLIGVEGLWGYRQALGGASGDAWRGQFNLQYTF